MNWNSDTGPEKFDKAALERSMAKIAANERCAARKKDLEENLQAVRDNPGDKTSL
ncbi:MAG: hypothetical protein WAN61_01530 [Minisyncoccia bacterium]